MPRTYPARPRSPACLLAAVLVLVASDGLRAGPTTRPVTGPSSRPAATSKPAPPTAKQLAEARAILKRLTTPAALTDAEKRRAEKLIADLGADAWKVREAATKALSAMGPAILPLVTAAAGSKDAEVATRAAAVLKALEARTADAGTDLTAAIDTLAVAADKTIVPALIGLLGHASAGVRYAAEYGLRRLAGQCFGYSAFAAPADRTAAAKKWRAWWAASKANFAFAEVRSPAPAGVLVADSTGLRVVAVTLAGKAVWSRKVSVKPYCAAGLDNGHVIVGYASGPQHVVEYDRAFKPVWDTRAAGLGAGMIYDLRRLPNGNTLIAYVGAGHVTELTGAGKVIWQMKGLKSPGAAVRLPNGNTLIVENHGSRVLEADAAGKVVWQHGGLSNPCDAQKLPNGNVLICEWGRKRVIEVTPVGKVVWDRKCAGNVSAARRLPDGMTVLAVQKEGVILVDARGKTIRKLHPYGGYGKMRLVSAACLKQLRAAGPATLPVAPKPAPRGGAQPMLRIRS